MGGHNTIVIHNTCEDSLLASPIILDLAILAELCNRIEFRSLSEPDSEYCKFHPVLSVLSYLCKVCMYYNMGESTLYLICNYSCHNSVLNCKITTTKKIHEIYFILLQIFISILDKIISM